MLQQEQLRESAVKPIIPQQATILIVEDNADNFFLAKTLIDLELHVKYCDGRPTGAQLFGMLAANPRLRPDLILLDIQIPHEDGFMVLKNIRSRPVLQSALVVACTAGIMPVEVDRARTQGFDGFIGKPIDADRFPDQIRRILAGEPVWEPR